MTLTTGSRIGVYEIGAPLGEGGMGQVFRATDTTLGRQVAIKILPQAFAADPDRLARFEREARTLASLNHPHIAAIFGFEKSGGVPALVMELVEGDDLARKIEELRAKGSGLPLDEALPIAKQIADALEAAHEHGIIHRDLKPANIKVRPDGVVKVLDFGLAKALDSGAGEGNAVPYVNSPTITSPAMTQAGMILGTAAYMAPEQARGRIVDRRADIWAFGAVLFEMLTARRVFGGDDVTDTIVSVVSKEPDWSALPASTPAPLRHLIARCLTKDPKARLRDIGEARIAVDAIINGAGDGAGSQPAPAAPTVVASRSSLLPWAVALAALVVAAYAGWRARGNTSAITETSPLHLQLNLDPAESVLGSDPIEVRVGSRRPSHTAIALSPDGRWLAFTGEQKGTQQLFLRDMRRDAGAVVAGTAGADSPFFSPDGQTIGFWANGALRKVPVDGGPVIEICKTDRILGADWGADGRILYGVRRGVIQIVAADGGAPSGVTKIDAATDEDEHRLPRWVSRDRLLFVAVARGGRNVRRLLTQRMDGSDRRVLAEDATDGRVVAGGSHLVFMRGATLMAAPFDIQSASLTGAAQGVIDGVMVSLNAPNLGIDIGAGQFAVSDSGTFVYLPGQMFEDVAGTLTWLDRQGRTQPIDMSSGGYLAARISPDGRRAVAVTLGAKSGSAFWVYNLDRGSLEKLPVEGNLTRAIWEPDGQGIVFGGSRAQDNGLYRIRLGLGAVERLPGGVRNPSPAGWARDGREIVYVETISSVDGGSDTDDIFAVSLEDKKTRPLVQTKARDSFPAMSPDGRWLAYASDESGRYEVLVQPYDGGARVAISTNGGQAPRWTRDGKTLIYSKPILETQSGDRTRLEMWEVPLTITTTVVPGTPRKFAGLTQEDFGSSSPTADYDVAGDGRLLGTTRRLLTPPPPKTLSVITNWFEELRTKAPVRK